METIKETDREYICEIQAPCFQKMSVEEKELIKRKKTTVLFRKGENLTKQGAFASYILFIVDGLVKQYVEGDATHNFNIRLLLSGEFIGLPVVFDKGTFYCSSVAVKDTTAFLIEKDAIESVIKHNGEFAFQIIRRYSQQDTNLYQIIRNMMYKQMNGRLADALLYLSSDTFKTENVFQYLSRRDIAEFAGLSTESTVKLLKTFEKDELIVLREKNILIKNREMLSEISRRG